jgi:tetraacyldisaccharide 4'-kinase
LLLARRSGVPVWIGADRAAAGRALLAAEPAVNVLLCDDGLQHYALARDVEIAVFDGRGLGNGRLLPAGPLREPASRLRGVSAVVCNGEPAPSALAAQAAVGAVPLFRMQLQPGEFYDLRDPARRCSAADLRGQSLVALAGIGDPRRFFSTLQALGLACEERPFPDHHAYAVADLLVPAGAALLLTEKDAVKCAPLLQAHPDALTAPVWVLPVEAEVAPDLTAYLLEKLDGRSPAGNPGLPGV